MNAVEIEQAVDSLCSSRFESKEFPYQFLEAFGEKKTTIKRLRAIKNSTNKSDIPGGVLQRNNIHMVVSERGGVEKSLRDLRASTATIKYKANFILATDGDFVEAENLTEGEVLACSLEELPDHFGFFLALAGIATVKQIRENAFDIKATSRMNRLYVELQKNNPDWDTERGREDLNHFFARLIFCFFAEDTGIFHQKKDLFIGTIQAMSDRDGKNTHQIIREIFRAMNIDLDDRKSASLPRYASAMPYVNGGLFEGSVECPKFTKIARSYLISIGSLDWTKINPDIFGSMIQAVAEEKERSELGLHYTSVPNILRVLDPLFLDDLKQQLHDAGKNKRKLLSLRNRLARIRVFDPACGSGNFLVVAYKAMREIEAEINNRRGESHSETGIPLTNFRGIEVRSFAAEIARLALVIAKFQCDREYCGEQRALSNALPVSKENWITWGNALKLDWGKICPPVGISAKASTSDMFRSGSEGDEINFDNQGGETFICGNPPYAGSKFQSTEQKDDLRRIFNGRIKKWKSLDYVTGWFLKAADYNLATGSSAGFVATNTVNQGQQVSILWPTIFDLGQSIQFAYTSFTWANLARHKAGVTVVIVGLTPRPKKDKSLFIVNSDDSILKKTVPNINAYLIAGKNVIVGPSSEASSISKMQFGNHPYYGTSLIFPAAEGRSMIETTPGIKKYLRKMMGSTEFIEARPKSCLWIKDDEAEEALKINLIKGRIAEVIKSRQKAAEEKNDKSALKLLSTPYRFRDQSESKSHAIVVPRVSSSNREYLPVGIVENSVILNDRCFAMYDAPLWNLSILASRMHLVWISTVCVRRRKDFSYSNTLGWNTFPIPGLTNENKLNLEEMAKEILVAREVHFPASLAFLYEPEFMPENVRKAHRQNDETIERIYMGRCAKNDSERLEILLEHYRMNLGKNK